MACLPSRREESVMQFFIDELEILFPHPHIYPEQYQYMCLLKQSLDARHAASQSAPTEHTTARCVELPPGAGKTTAALSFFASYMDAHSDRVTQLVYCPRSAGEIAGVIEQAERVLAHRASTQRGTRAEAHPISLSLHRDCGSQCSQWTTMWHHGDDLSFSTRLRGNIVVCPVSCLLAHELRQELTTQLSTAVVVDGIDQFCKTDSTINRETLQRASSVLETLSSHIATVPHTQHQPHY